jgi:hypothetical protein
MLLAKGLQQHRESDLADRDKDTATMNTTNKLLGP